MQLHPDVDPGSLGPAPPPVAVVVVEPLVPVGPVVVELVLPPAPGPLVEPPAPPAPIVLEPPLPEPPTPVPPPAPGPDELLPSPGDCASFTDASDPPVLELSGPASAAPLVVMSAQWW
jgi:hypothetical protein